MIHTLKVFFDYSFLLVLHNTCVLCKPTEDIRLRKERYIKLLYNKIRPFLKNLKKLIGVSYISLNDQRTRFRFFVLITWRVSPLPKRVVFRQICDRYYMGSPPYSDVPTSSLLLSIIRKTIALNS